MYKNEKYVIRIAEITGVGKYNYTVKVLTIKNTLGTPCSLVSQVHT